jgi:two-component system LytT family response regulator
MDAKIKAIIIDDEDRARELLKSMLLECCPEVEVVALCNDIPSAVKSIKKYTPDLVFSDIEMPGHSGLELLDFFNEEEIHFSLIFTTAYNQYAIQAMKMSAIDYLLKPIEPEELEKAVEVYKKKIKQESLHYKAVLDNFKTNKSSKLAVPTRHGFRFVDPDDIVLLKADNSYTEVILNNGEKLLASRILRNFEDALAHHPHFFRTHKSYLINTNYITEYIKSDGGYIILNKDHQASISPDKVQEFMEKVISVKR